MSIVDGPSWEAENPPLYTNHSQKAYTAHNPDGSLCVAPGSKRWVYQSKGAATSACPPGGRVKEHVLAYLVGPTW